MSEEQKDTFITNNAYVFDLWGIGWAVIIACAFIFSRGCDGEQSNFETYVNAKYHHEATEVNP